MLKINRNNFNRRVFSTLTPSLFSFSAISLLFISRAARYTPSSQRQSDEKWKQFSYQFIVNTYLKDLGRGRALQ